MEATIAAWSDVQLVDNGRILHAREAYDDDPDPARRRHLLRMWLAADRFASLEPGLRSAVAPPARTDDERRRTTMRTP